jgi:hypothetical protein
MPFILKAQRRITKKGKKSATLNTILPPGELVDVASLKGRNRDLLHAPSVSTILLPGKTEFAINVSNSNTAHGDSARSGEYIFDQFPIPLQDYSIDSDEEDQSRRRRNRTQARRSKANIAARWSETVLPRILPIYVNYQARCSRGLAQDSDHGVLNEPCECQGGMRLKITVLRWNCEYIVFIYLSQAGPDSDNL